MPKCPVCKNEFAETDDLCPSCGFTDIHKEFINKDDLNRWMEETVTPCQAVYKKMSSLLCSSSNRVLDEIKDRFGANDVIYNDDTLLITFLKWGMNHSKSGWTADATFVLENKTESTINVYFKNVSTGGYLNQEKTKIFSLPPKHKRMENLVLLYEDKIPVSMFDFGSAEFSVCYSEAVAGRTSLSSKPTFESHGISLKFK